MMKIKNASEGSIAHVMMAGSPSYPFQQFRSIYNDDDFLFPSVYHYGVKWVLSILESKIPRMAVSRHFKF